jgi:hypothetical protein
MLDLDLLRWLYSKHQQKEEEQQQQVKRGPPCNCRPSIQPWLNARLPWPVFASACLTGSLMHEYNASEAELRFEKITHSRIEFESV